MISYVDYCATIIFKTLVEYRKEKYQTEILTSTKAIAEKKTYFFGSDDCLDMLHT